MTRQEILEQKYFKVVEETSTPKYKIRTDYYFKMVEDDTFEGDALLFCEYIEIVHIDDELDEYHYHKKICQVINNDTSPSECWLNPNDLIKITEEEYLKHKLV